MQIGASVPPFSQCHQLSPCSPPSAHCREDQHLSASPHSSLPLISLLPLPHPVHPPLWPPRSEAALQYLWGEVLLLKVQNAFEKIRSYQSLCMRQSKRISCVVMILVSSKDEFRIPQNTWWNHRGSELVDGVQCLEDLEYFMDPLCVIKQQIKSQAFRVLCQRQNMKENVHTWKHLTQTHILKGESAAYMTCLWI